MLSCSSCLRAQWRQVDLIGCPVRETLVSSAVVVEVEVGTELAARLAEILAGLEVGLLVLDGPPLTFPPSLDERAGVLRQKRGGDDSEAA